MSIDLSLVIPAYNEASRLPLFLSTLLQDAANSGMHVECIVVDDGSVDNTAALVRDLARSNDSITLLENDLNRGKGYSVRRGFSSASGAIIGFIDADGAYTFADVQRALELFGDETSIVIGSRRVLNDQSSEPVHRHMLSELFNAFVRSVLGVPFRDTQCGMKLLRRSALELILPQLTIDWFSFDVELLYIAHLRNLSVAECYVQPQSYSGSKVRAVRDSFRMALNVLRIRYRHQSQR